MARDKLNSSNYNLQNILTFWTYGTGIEPVLPFLSLAVHHCSSSLNNIVKISPFLKLRSSFS